MHNSMAPQYLQYWGFLIDLSSVMCNKVHTILMVFIDEFDAQKADAASI
jgi:hypothetical protein